MPVDPVTIGLGAASLIQGKNANRKAENEANSAKKSQKAIEQRMTKLFDVMFNRADQAAQSGYFDPEKRISQLEKDTSRYEGQDMGNLAGAMRIAGYKPGDSETGVRLDATKLKYRRFLDQMRNEIRDKSWFDQQNAYASAGSANLTAPLASAQNRQGMALSQIQSPAGFMGNLMPMLGGGGGGGFKIPRGVQGPTKDNPFYR